MIQPRNDLGDFFIGFHRRAFFLCAVAFKSNSENVAKIAFCIWVADTTSV